MSTDTTTLTTTQHAIVQTALGELTLVGTADGLAGVYFAEHSPSPDRDGFGSSVDVGADPLLAEAAAQLQEYLAGGRTTWDLPLDPRGSERARQVWDLIAAIPYGTTTTYGALAGQVGLGARGLGWFVAHNPLSIVVPCHRVVGSGGKLTGYAGGLDRKRQLLQLEGALPTPTLTPPAD